MARATDGFEGGKKKWLSTQGKLQTIGSPQLLAGTDDDCKWGCVRVHHKLDIAEGAAVSLDTQNPSKLHT